MYCHISIGNLICFFLFFFLEVTHPCRDQIRAMLVKRALRFIITLSTLPGARPNSYCHLYRYHTCVKSKKMLTHWGRVTHICVSKLTIIGSDNGLSPGRRQAIFRTNAGILLIGPSATNFSEILIGIETFSFKKIHLKMSSAKWRPFCLGLNVLK